MIKSTGDKQVGEIRFPTTLTFTANWLLISDCRRAGSSPFARSPNNRKWHDGVSATYVVPLGSYTRTSTDSISRSRRSTWSLLNKLYGIGHFVMQSI